MADAKKTTTTNTGDVADPNTDLATRFPAYAWMLNEPGVMAALGDTSLTTADQFIAAVQGTDWWKNTLPSMRSYQQLQAQDPEGFKQQLGQESALINDNWTSLGLKSDPRAQSALADQALRMGWSSQQLQDNIVQYSRAHPEQVSLDAAGLLQSTATKLKTTANNYYVALDDNTANSWAQQVAAGEKKDTDFISVLQGQAANKFANSPDVVNALNNGISTSDYFAGYKNEAAKLLEMDPNQVDMMNNPMFSKILTGGDPQGGTNRVMSMSQMDQYLRTTDKYNHTRGAINDVVGAWTDVAKLMGKQA